MSFVSAFRVWFVFLCLQSALYGVHGVFETRSLEPSFFNRKGTFLAVEKHYDPTYHSSSLQSEHQSLYSVGQLSWDTVIPDIYGCINVNSDPF